MIEPRKVNWHEFGVPNPNEPELIRELRSGVPLHDNPNLRNLWGEEMLRRWDALLAEVDRGREENAELRNAIGSAQSLLWLARSFRGYDGPGPLHEPWAAHVMRRLESALTPSSGGGPPLP